MRYLMVGVVVGMVLGSSARAASAACYEFSFSDTPEALDPAPVSQPGRTQIWCYQRWSQDGGEATLLYAIGDEPRAELTALVLRDAAGDIRRLAHGSRSRGQLRYHATGNFLVNPMPVPLDETGASMLAPAVAPVMSDSYRLRVESIRAKLQASNTSKSIYQVAPGLFETKLPQESLPYGAYWWPYSQLELSSGERSPLGKYDGYMESVTGVNPRAAEWENDNHSDVAVEWGGHCNGWAASAILHEEITEPRWDAGQQLFFYNNDINGIFAEASFCVDWAFYGVRNYGDGDLEDVSASKFHKVLIYYLQELQKPVAMDYFRNEAVDNNVIVGYSLDISAVPDVTGQFAVNATILARNYDMERSDALGPAEERTFTYSYILEVDAQSEIIGGHWTGGDNPDFMWVPLAQARCGRENPRIDTAAVDSLLATLPRGIRQSSPSNYSLSVAGLEPGGTLRLMGEIYGGGISVLVGQNKLPATAMLVVRGTVARPSSWWQGEQEMFWQASWLGTGAWELPFDHLKSIDIVNGSDTKFLTGSIELLGVEYWAPPQ